MGRRLARRVFGPTSILFGEDENLLTNAPVTITATATPAATVVSVTGELDLTVADRFRRHLSEALAATPLVLIIDLTEVSFCSATILGVLLDIKAAADAAHVAWAIVSDRPAVRRPITITGLDPALRPLASVAEAYAQLAKHQPASSHIHAPM